MQKNRKILLVITFLFFISLVAVARYSFLKNQIALDTNLRNIQTIQPSQHTSSSSSDITDLSPEAIAEWDVCRNEKYGYEFKYPKGWYVYGSYTRNPPQVTGKTLCEQGMGIHVSSTGPNTRHEPQKKVFFIFAENQTDLIGTLSEGVQSIEEYRNSALKVTPSILPVSKKTITAGEVTLWTVNINNNLLAMTAEFFHKGTVYTSHSELLDYEVHSAILSTFIFIDK